MNELKIMNIHGIECYEEGGTAYLKLETVARGLGFTQEKSGVEYVKWERVESYLAELGFPHKWGKGDFIPENIFYRLAMKAKNAVAEAFQAKIADEVIPSIRKHGAYMTPDTIEKLISNPDTIIQLATALKEEQEKRLALMGENIQLKSELDKSKEWYSIKRVARINGVSHRRFDWRKLKRESVAQGHGVRKIFDANYGEVNVYHMNVWERVYPDMEL